MKAREQVSKVRAFRPGKNGLEKMLDALKTAGVKEIFIEQDGTASGEELDAVRQAYQFLLQI